jgi:hypothetical protein
VIRRAAAWRAIGATLMLLALPGRAAAPPGEYQVKAVYLFNFGRFVEWPPRVFEAADTPFVIGIFGDDPFGATVDEVVRGEKVGTRPIVVERFRDTAAIGRCHILFIGRVDAPRLDEALAAVRGRSVLTVTDVDGAERQGAIIVLYNQNNRIRMRINLPQARASDLVISSKLLRPAEVIGGEGG